MDSIYKSGHFIVKILTSAAINQLIDVPAAFLCVLTVFSIDLLCCVYKLRRETVAAQSKRTLTETHVQHI